MSALGGAVLALLACSAVVDTAGQLREIAFALLLRDRRPIDTAA